MTPEEWRQLRNNRSLRYAGRVLDPAKRIVIHADERYVSQYAGQVFMITAANLLSRMTPAISVAVPDVELVSPLPWAGVRLPDFLMEIMNANDPGGMFRVGSDDDSTYVIGAGVEGHVTGYGSGWNVYVGRELVHLPEVEQPNPFGPALSAILSIAQLFRMDFQPVQTSTFINTLNWTHETLAPVDQPFPNSLDVGDLWTIGAGSVGTAILYFLGLLTRQFSATLADMDIVKIYNLDRSPVFIVKDVYSPKVEATARFLLEIGVKNITTLPVALDQCPEWQQRELGTPNITLSAANERNVRQLIEQFVPPVQIYGTTGTNWEAAVIRHEYGKGACSCCLFPPNQDVPPTICAEAKIERPDTGEQVDAALPFLSFAAGLMAAAEIVKLQLPEFPFSTDRAVLNMYTEPLIMRASVPVRPGCPCQSRSCGLISKVREQRPYRSLNDNSKMDVAS